MRRGKQACKSHARESGSGRVVGAPGDDPGSGSYRLPALPLSYAPVVPSPGVEPGSPA